MRKRKGEKQPGDAPIKRATASGTWGDATQSSAEFGQRYLDVVVRSTARLLEDIERTFTAMPDR